LDGVVLQVREDAGAGGGTERSERAAVADDGQPLNQAQEEAQLALESGGAVAQESFGDGFEIAPALAVERGCLGDDGGHDGPEYGTKGREGGPGIGREGHPTHHITAVGAHRSGWLARVVGGAFFFWRNEANFA
jgi:hypothetical protein